MQNVRNKYKKNKLIIIFLSYYIIGLVFSVVFSADTKMLTDGVKGGFDVLKGLNWFHSVAKLSFSFFSVSLMLWAICVFVYLFNASGIFGGAVALYLGYSSGCSTAVMISGFGKEGILFSLLCIIPASMIRFFLWYRIYISIRKMRYLNDRQINKPSRMISGLIIILLSDIFISIITVVCSKIIF